MDEDFKYDVFLSHSTKDKPVVRELRGGSRPTSCAFGSMNGKSNLCDSIPAKVEEGLEHSRVLVLGMSASAFGSDWAQLEAGTFRFRDPLNKESCFIPLRLDGATVKGSLSRFLYINWLPEDGEQEPKTVFPINVLQLN